VGAGLEVGPGDAERPGLAVPLEVEAGDELVAHQQGQDVVPVLALGQGDVDLDAVVEAEEAPGPVPLPYQRVEGRQQGGLASDRGPRPGPGEAVGRLAPTLRSRARGRPTPPARPPRPWRRGA